ncbi:MULTISPECIES: aldo/keto reductase [unclassified Caulobacter]|uniref:aldo/keto reductase n=1 Tax=unclassified Caulobacter TaxID=2648921 RepID=UPI0006FBE50A|nr:MULTISPECIES: aldo/keto reductase [unclassified Caulobacter]KQV55174.1 2,5-didehydrogluconate reductase [Caulobacter sp. Root342]KQV63637.1 2,5-didehydrogluconate reductase [Caulobacter sp. Root343]
MSKLVPAVRSGDVLMPALGFGTWQLDNGTAVPLVEKALEVGYRHIDTAQIYRNERDVGAAIRNSGIKRDEIFLTTKVWIDHFADGDLQRSAEKSLEKLGVDHVDLLLLHWPKPDVPLAQTLKALNEVRSRGLTRAIGLSNFPSALLEETAQLSEAPIATDQVEYHPYLSLKTLIAKAHALGTSITAWSPLAQGKVAQDPTLIEIGRAHGKTPGQVTLRWLVQQGVIAIPRTSNPARIAENFDILDFSLTDEEMTRIHGLARPDGRLGDWLDKAYAWDEA